MLSAASMFKALSDDTRLDIMALLLERHELCVCHFESLLGISQSRASRHLRYLSNAGLVTDRREGVWVHYRLAPDASPGGRALLAALPDILDPARLQRARQALSGEGSPSCPEKGAEAQRTVGLAEQGAM